MAPNWWRKVFGGGARALPAAQSVSVSLLAAPYATGPKRGSREILLAYRHDGWLQSVTGLVANGVAGATWRAYKPVAGARHVFRGKGQERTAVITKALAARELVEVPDHEVLRILDRPSADFSGHMTAKLIQLHLDLVGEAFLFLQRDAAGRLTGFVPLPPHCVQFLPTEASPFYRVSYNRLRGSVPASEMIHLRQADPHEPHGRGAGIGIGLGDELDASESIAQALKAIFERGGQPTTLVAVDAGPDGDQEEIARDLEKRFTSGHVGAHQAGKSWFIPGKGVQVATINADLKQLQTAELAKRLQDYVRHCFNVPPELMGDLSASNRATSEAAKYHLAEYAIQPRLEFLRSELMAKLIPLVDSEVVLEFDDPRPQSFERIQALMTNPTTAPAFTLNEVRELAGYGRVADGDVHILPMPGQFDPKASSGPA